MTTRHIRNSTAEFLIFTGQAGEQSIEARYEDDSIWLSQKLMAELFAVDVRTISEHLQNIFKSEELAEQAVIRKFRTTVAVAKNYLSKDELDSLGRIVNAYLELAEDRAQRKIPMSMEDWAKRLDAFLEFDERELLQGGGRISAQLAQEHAQSEFEKFRIVQDRLFESDFDRLLGQQDDE
jgi:hypothetical protein